MRAQRSPEGWDLTSIPWVRRLLLDRWPQWLVTAVALAFFAYAVVSGLFGTEVGNRNLAITLVWIAWWALLMLVLVPFGGRIWCSVCPIPAPGDWFQRGGLLTIDGRTKAGYGKRWPRRLRNLWLQNIGFLLMAIFSTVILTQPSVTAWVLLTLFGIALVVSVVFERRTFCRYLCPVGGFIGLYALVSPLALRVKNSKMCRGHSSKDCYRGSELGHGCPWMVYTGTLDRNAYCGLCFECLRTCPEDNVRLILRKPGADLGSTASRPPLGMDEAYKGFIMMTAAGVYSAVLMGPWGELKQAAYSVGSTSWLIYAGVFLGLALFGLPGAYFLAARLGWSLSRERIETVRDHFLRSVTGLVPLGLAAWMSFSLVFVLINGSYVLATLSDPLGWGWNLFGTAAISWQPLLSGWLPSIQAGVLLVGLVWATATTLRAFTGLDSYSRETLLGVLPTLLLNAALTWLHLSLSL